MIRKCFLIFLAFMFINCNHQLIEGEYYIDKSDTKIVFSDNFLTIQEGNEVTIESTFEKRDENNVTYSISEIKLNSAMENHKKSGLELGKKIYINKSSIIEENNKFQKNILQINGNFYGNTFTYDLNKDCLKTKSIKNAGLFDIEVENFENRNTISLIDTYDISLVGNYNKVIKKNIKYVFDKNSKTIALLPLDIVSNFGLEFSIKYRIDDNKNDGEDEGVYEEDLEIEDEIVVRAVKFDISEEVFFYYYRPAKITLMFSPSKKECPGFKKYIYETETKINLENRCGKQIFYFMDDIPACQSIFIMIDEFYEGLTDKIVISDIEFFIK